MKIIFKKIFSFAAVALLFFPALAFASGGSDIFGLNAIRSLFCNEGPACSQTLVELILSIIHLLLFISGSLAVLFIIIGGFFYITSNGNQERAERGRKTVTNAIIGLIIVMLSYTIVSVIQNTVSQGL